MLESGKTRAVRAFVTASPPHRPDADLYRRYAAVLYRQALLTRLAPALAEHVAGERALVPIPQRARAIAVFLHAVTRRLASSPAAAAKDAAKDTAKDCTAKTAVR
jgi:hypothetical protein